MPAGGERGRFAQRVLKRVQGLSRVPGHKKTKPVELRQAVRKVFGSLFFQAASLKAASAARKGFPSLPNPKHALLVRQKEQEQAQEQDLGKDSRFQTARDFLRVFPTVEGRDAEIAFAFRAESAPRSNDDV